MSDPEITDPRDPYKQRDIVAELDGELALIAELPYRVPIHLLAKRARDEIVALRSARNECERQFQEQVAEVSRLLCQLEAVKGIAGNERKLSEAIIQQARDEALEEAAQRCDRLATDYTIPISANNFSDGCRGCAGRIRALKADK